MEYTIAVVDDRQEDRDRLAADLHAWFDDKGGANVQCYPDAETMFRSFFPGKFQIAFLDIVMKGADGIELASRIRQLDAKLLLIFYTNSREYVFDVFPVHPFDYLVKPYGQIGLSRVLEDALAALSETELSVTVRVDRAPVMIPFSQIMTASSQGHSVEIVTADGARIRTAMTFTDFAKQLGPDRRFLQCNRGLTVNMDYVLTIQDDSIRMINGDICPLRTKGRGELLAQFSQYQIFRLKRGKT